MPMGGLHGVCLDWRCIGGLVAEDLLHRLVRQLS